MDLSLRARGLWLVIWGLPAGAPISSRNLMSRVPEGRDAVRAALRELEAAGMLEDLRVRHGTHWVRSNTYWVRSDSQASEWSDSQAHGREVRLPDHLIGWSESQASGPPSGPIVRLPDRSDFQASASSLSLEREKEEDEVRTQVQERATLDSTSASDEDVSTAAAVTVPSQIPWDVVHLLRTWFGVTDKEAWEAAWRTAASTNGEGEFDVAAHMVGYLTRCREQRRDVTAGTWLRFCIEDRVKWIDSRHHEAEVREQRSDSGESWVLNTFSQTPKWD